MRLIAILFLACTLFGGRALASVPTGSEPLRLLDRDLGGGDGIVTGPTRTLAWILLGSGVAVGGLGVLVVTEQVTGVADGLGPTLVGVGAAAAVAGAVLLWTTGCVSCGTCGIVENQRRDAPPPNEALASRKERSDPAPTRLGFAYRF